MSHPTKKGHFVEVLPSQSLSMVLMQLDLTQKQQN